MERKLIANLTSEENVVAIYSNIKYIDHASKKVIYYTIICENDNIMEDYTLLKKIIATMEIIKELVAYPNIYFNYKIKSINELDREANENRNEVTNELANSEILYCKDHYIDELAEEGKTKKRG